MLPLSKLLVIGLLALPALAQDIEVATDNTLTPVDKKAKQFIEQLDRAQGKRYHDLYLALWNYETNITDYNREVYTNISNANAKNDKEVYVATNKFDWRNFKNETLKRWFGSYGGGLGYSALSADKYEQLQNILNFMLENYSNAKICDYKNRTKCDLYLNPDIIDLFATSTDPEELKYVFVEWHKAAGTTIKSNYTQYVALLNEAAVLNNFTSAADNWQAAYESTDFESQLTNLMKQFQPLYEQLHAYVRRKLREKYGADIVSAKGPIPGHLLGDLWGLTWIYTEPFTRPYPDIPDANVTKGLLEKKYTPLRMIQNGDNFMRSLNMSKLSANFYKNSYFVNPNDGRQFDCHESAWDFNDGKDFRVKACLEVNADWFEVVYHELGHIQYYMQSKDNVIGLRGAANPAFQAAVGDTFGLSVFSPKHLLRIGLINQTDFNQKTEINALFRMALDKVAFLPFGLLLDLYRYRLFRGTTTPENYNCHYWHLKYLLQGFQPPVKRTEADFDAGAKYHMNANSEYIMYYISYFLQFQFHKRLCELAGEYAAGDPNKKLYNCDIYNSAAAGNAYGHMLSQGATKPWQDILEGFDGQRVVNASGILEYFEPLYQWLKADNAASGEHVGWEPSTVEYCTAEQIAAGLPTL